MVCQNFIALFLPKNISITGASFSPYENKIEIGINYAVNAIQTTEPFAEKVFTETRRTQRRFKNNTIKTSKKDTDNHGFGIGNILFIIILNKSI